MVKCTDCLKYKRKIVDAYEAVSLFSWYMFGDVLVCPPCIRNKYAVHNINRLLSGEIDRPRKTKRHPDKDPDYPGIETRFICQEIECYNISPERGTEYRKGQESLMAHNCGWEIRHGLNICPECLRDVYAAEELDKL